MPWSAIILAIIQIFGPYIMEWLKKWLESKLNKASTNATDIANMFDIAIKDLPRVAVMRRLFLRSVKTICLNHETDILSGTPVNLSQEEISLLSDINFAMIDE